MQNISSIGNMKYGDAGCAAAKVYGKQEEPLAGHPTKRLGDRKNIVA